MNINNLFLYVYNIRIKIKYKNIVHIKNKAFSYTTFMTTLLNFLRFFIRRIVPNSVPLVF